MNESRVIFTLDAARALRDAVDLLAPSGVTVIADSTVASVVLPSLSLPSRWKVATFPAGEEHKNLESCVALWRSLIAGEMNRRSLVINIGGGVTTDMGGWVASTFKRGVKFINVLTTLLCAVDAAVGGKTGVDFDGLKNEIGAFAPASAVIIDSRLFATLDVAQMLSGYGEMLKHALLHSAEMWAETLSLDILDASPEQLNSLIEKNIAVKRDIVAADPYEQSLRKALNLGHTFGHALESFCLRRGTPVAHGIAVIHGLLVAMILSHLRVGLPTDYLYQLVAVIKQRGASVPAITCNDYDELISLMTHDKKNVTPGHINFTLLSSPGTPLVDQPVPTTDIPSALDIYRDLIS